jgi:diguanylate cyclase (GGDEF)-like protein
MPTVLLVNFPSSEGCDIARFLTERHYACLPFLPSLTDPTLLDSFDNEINGIAKIDVAIICLPENDSALLERMHLFLRRIRALNSTTCVIVSGNPVSIDDVSTLMRGGVYDYLKFPIPLDKLESTIEHGLQTRDQAEEIIRSMASANERLVAEKDLLERWNQDLSRLYHVNQTLASFLNPGMTISTFAESLKPLIPYDTLSIFLKGRGGADRVWVFPHQNETTDRDYINEEAKLLGAEYPFFDEKSETRALPNGFEVFVPLVIATEKLGILRITRTTKKAEDPNHATFSEYQRRMLLMVATSLSLSLRNADMYQQVKELAVTDELTHILNRRAFLNILERELKRSNRLETTMALLLIDLDHFKEVNDIYGHLAGDAVLQEIAPLLNQSIREIDALARYGGEEFVIILPEVKPAEAMIAAERIKHLVETHIFRKDKDPIHLTVSIGMAISPLSSAKNPEDLFHLADLALYLAKKKGRNRIELSPPDVESVKTKEGRSKSIERTRAR